MCAEPTNSIRHDCNNISTDLVSVPPYLDIHFYFDSTFSSLGRLPVIVIYEPLFIKQSRYVRMLINYMPLVSSIVVVIVRRWSSICPSPSEIDVYKEKEGKKSPQ